MAERSPRGPEHHAGHPSETRAAQTVRGGCATRVLMLLLTGASVALWVLAQLDDDVKAREPIWLLIIITLTAWPSYGAWCSHQRTTRRITELERRREADYGSGYADGYLDCLAGHHRPDPAAEPAA